jgi:hypothetical protein
MTRLASRLAGFTVATLLATAAVAHAAPQVSIGVGIGVGAPPPVAVAVPPPPPPAAVVVGAPVPYGYVYRPGYYMWTGYGYQMVPGAYVRPPYAGAVWVAPRYASGPHGHYYVHGYWRH